MLHPVGGEDGHVAGVEMDRHGDDYGALGIAETLGHGGGDVRVLERLLVLRERGPPERGVPLERRRFLDRSHGRGV